jgi:hypothetical protein
MLNLQTTRTETHVITADGRTGCISHIGSNPYTEDNRLYAYVEGIWQTGHLIGFRWADYFPGDQLDPAEPVDETQAYFDWLHDHTVDLDAPGYLPQMVDVMLNGLDSIRSADALERVKAVLKYDLELTEGDELTAAVEAITERLKLWGANAWDTQIGKLALKMEAELERRRDAEEAEDDPYRYADDYEDDIRGGW